MDKNIEQVVETYDDKYKDIIVDNLSITEEEYKVFIFSLIM